MGKAIREGSIKTWLGKSSELGVLVCKPGKKDYSYLCMWTFSNWLGKQMLKKARQKKCGRHPTILSRWYASESYRNSFYAIGSRGKHKMLYDTIALEKHIYVATRAERIQNSKHWIRTLNAEGPQQPLNQRPDFAHAKKECERLHAEHVARTQEEF